MIGLLTSMDINLVLFTAILLIIAAGIMMAVVAATVAVLNKIRQHKADKTPDKVVELTHDA